MRLLVSEVTRMWRGYCVAGLLMNEGRMVRPLHLGHEFWPEESIGEDGWDVGNIIDVQPRCSAPWACSPRNVNRATN